MGFLGNHVPSIISWIALAIVGFSLFTTFSRVVGDGGKEIGSIKTDAAFQVAPWMFMAYIVISFFIRESFLYNFYYYLLNLIFVFFVSSVGSGLITLFCKFNFSKELNNDKEYKSLVHKMKDNRGYGLIFNVCALIVCRLMIRSYYGSARIYTTLALIGFISSILCCYFYSKNRTIEQKANKGNKKSPKDSDKNEGDVKTNEEKKSEETTK